MKTNGRLFVFIVVVVFVVFIYFFANSFTDVHIGPFFSEDDDEMMMVVYGFDLIFFSLSMLSLKLFFFVCML